MLNEADYVRLGSLALAWAVYFWLHSLLAALSTARDRGTLVCCADDRAYALADVVVIDVPLDIDWRSSDPQLQLDGFTSAIRAVGRNATAGTLVIVETTVPPESKSVNTPGAAGATSTPLR